MSVIQSPISISSEERKKITIHLIQAMKGRHEVISMLTAYDYPTALVMDQVGMDIILVGDSLGMVVLGYESTLPVTMDEMIHHCKAVARGAQTVHKLGGYRPQGRDAEAAYQLLEDALILQEAGCFSLVLESIPGKLARLVSERLAIPTIGIGAGVGCDGQVLVTHDLLGVFPRFTPRFVRQSATRPTGMGEA